jgi:hypothetical protein
MVFNGVIGDQSISFAHNTLATPPGNCIIIKWRQRTTKTTAHLCFGAVENSILAYACPTSILKQYTDSVWQCLRGKISYLIIADDDISGCISVNADILLTDEIVFDEYI